MNINDIQRFLATTTILNRLVGADSTVIEVGATDASFRAKFRCKRWTTVDKFGDPDVVIDINGANAALPF